MGLFNYVEMDHPCPACGKPVTQWQTKECESELYLQTVSPNECDEYHAICACGEWIQYARGRNTNPFELVESD